MRNKIFPKNKQLIGIDMNVYKITGEDNRNIYIQKNKKTYKVSKKIFKKNESKFFGFAEK